MFQSLKIHKIIFNIQNIYIDFFELELFEEIEHIDILDDFIDLNLFTRLFYHKFLVFMKKNLDIYSFLLPKIEK